MSSLAYPNIDWTSGDAPKAPAEPIDDPSTIQPLIIMTLRTSIPFPSSSSVAPDAAIGFATAS